MLIKKVLKSQDSFLQSAKVLAGGTAFAQLIGVLVLPVLTRLYTPDDFALFAVYTSILGILSVAICLRFEIAIPLPDKDEDALSLVILALISNISLTVIISVIIFIFKELILETLMLSELENLIWYIPIGVFSSGLYNTLQYWTTRKKQFNIIAKTRMTQSIASSSVQLGSGFIGFGTLGLIIGQIINFSAGITRLFVSFRKETKVLLPRITQSQLKRNWINYDKFPKYSTFESLANVATVQLPIIIIASVAIGPEAGYLMLAMKVMAIPITLIGNAMAQVYLAHAPEYYLKGGLKTYTINVIRKIAKIAIIPIFIIGILAPFIFPFIFGVTWNRAGDMVLWMIPWFVMQVLSAPVSMSLHITGNQQKALALQIVGLIIRVLFLYIVSMYYLEWVFEYYAISGFLFYTLYLTTILIIIKD